MRQVTFAYFLLISFLPRYALAQQYPTLADVLQQSSVSFHLRSLTHLNDPITSYATLNTDREFLIAYYLVSPEDANALHFPLLLDRFDKRSAKWQEKSLTDLKMRTPKQTDPVTQPDCLGSVVSLEGNGGWYYLNLHWTPSAGCLVVLNPDFTVHQTLPGWTVAFFKSGSVVYQGNMVHFAPVHAESLFLYDPVAGNSREIYPLKNDPFRKKFSERLENVIDEKRCRESNWPCDPGDFETGIGPIEVNDETQALAFRVGFGTEGFLPREEAEDSGQWDDDDYVYICQLSPFRWREFSAYDLRPKFGTDSLTDLLTPSKLRQVFATPPPH